MPDLAENLALDAAEQRLVAWVEQKLDGTVIGLERQKRWRPAWFADVRTKDGVVSLYLRGDRTSKSIAAPFDDEYRLMQVLEANGIPVPHIYGFCPDPATIVMAKAPGRGDLSTAVDETERRTVMDEYIEILARIHAIDPKQFAAAGLKLPTSPQDIALGQFEAYVGMYRQTKRRPEPMLEYFITWVRRNVPKHRTKVSFLACDVAQFLFEKGHLTAVIDFEMSYLGDPMQDVAALQLRDTNEPLGDVGRIVRRYAEVTGAPIDQDAFDFHAIEFAIVTPVSLAESLSRPLPLGSVVQYLEWWIHFSRMPLELMAARCGVTLTPHAPLKMMPPTFGIMSECLVGAIKAIPVDTEFATFEQKASAKLGGYVARAAQYEADMVRQDIAETESLLGAKFATWQEADAALERFVLNAGPDQDRNLIPLFYRRIQRQAEVLAPFISRPSVLNRFKPFSELTA